MACSPDLARRLAALGARAGREVGVLVSRHGRVVHALVGRNWPGLEATLAQRRDGRGLCGLRLLLTYGQPDAHPTDADLELLDHARLDLLVTIGQRNGEVTEVWVASRGRGGVAHIEGSIPPDALAHVAAAHRIRSAEQHARDPAEPASHHRAERAVLVGLVVPGREGWSTPATLEELRRLAETAGADVVDVVVQSRPRPDPSTLIGKGKVQELRGLCEREAADLVVFDEELTPAQQRTLEEELGIKVLDRTALVLDIFARRARTREGRLQVELAQMTYLLPRLVGRGVLLSRLGGGIGTRGPGETKLETDRRRIRSRITDLRVRIEEITRHRRMQRRARRAFQLPVVALVGYTNAGKSTLLNALTDAGVAVEDKLFATLDPTARRVELPAGGPAVVVDTVGFIQKLPTQLVAAFRATLEEITASDVLVHVLDVAHPDWPRQKRAVEEVLAELGATDRPIVLALNKVDRIPPQQARALIVQTGGVPISALRREGLAGLLEAVGAALPRRTARATLEVPYGRAGLLGEIYALGQVLQQDYGPDSIRLEVEAPTAVLEKIRSVAASDDRDAPSLEERAQDR
ncbi:MAG: GTPase HflX [Armatimonadota bacterium]|nr:GTPase HflX [Armatimonadota bacterium]MDR5696534.1 GTPase HflX [Armatimonadota bacterium]